jgi:uncharacterized protein (DUF1800 family)
MRNPDSSVRMRLIRAGYLAATWIALSAPLDLHAATPVGLSVDDARHLLTRTGFGATPAEISQYTGLARADAVDRVLRTPRTTPSTTPPAWATSNEPLRPPRPEAMTEAERKAFQQQNVKQGLELRAWWVEEMLVTPSPISERMTLFWHNHFVSSQQKVRLARLMYTQNATLRANALGNFGTLLHAVARDPAMVIYLDSVQNRKGTPNENFAREVMELFTLGEGHYMEQDIKEAARAFTGFSIDRESGTYVFRPRLHDDGVKTIFGRTGNFDGNDVIDLLLARPETSEFIVAKLWREFVSPEPDPRVVKRIARDFRDTRYDLRVAVRELLLTDAFWSEANRGTLVKSPVELVVGTLRTLSLTPESALPFAVAAAGMSQNLFSPPNVKGWPGGEAWINTNTLLARKQFLARVARADDSIAVPQASSVEATNASSMPGGASETKPAFVAAMPTAENSGADTTRTMAADSVLRSVPVPKAAIRPQGAADDDAARARRFAVAMDRGTRNLRLDAGVWVASLPGATPTEKLKAAQQMLLPLPPITPNVTEAIAERESTALVRAALLDPVFQLK